MLFGKLTAQRDLALDEIEHALLGLTVRAILGVHPRMPQTDGDFVQGPAVPSRVQRDGHRRSGPDSGRRFWAFVTTIPLTLLTLASLVAAWHAPAPRRESWLVAAVVILVERIATFSYFIPTMLRLQRAAPPQADVRARVAQWARLNYLRSALTLVAWLAALKALTLTTPAAR